MKRTLTKVSIIEVSYQIVEVPREFYFDLAESPPVYVAVHVIRERGVDGAARQTVSNKFG